VLDKTNIRERAKVLLSEEGQIVKRPTRRVPSIDETLYGKSRAETPPLTKTPSGIRRPFNTTFVPPPSPPAPSFSLSAWQKLQEDIKLAEKNRDFGYTPPLSKKQDPTELLATQREQLHFLPGNHPMNQKHVTAKRIDPPSDARRPKSNYRRLVKYSEARAQEEGAAGYQGAYTVPYRSQVEAEIQDFAESKKKFVGGVSIQLG